jgi:hypothetical protein
MPNPANTGHPVKPLLIPFQGNNPAMAMCVLELDTMAEPTGGWKPWKDGGIENTIKVCGVVLLFLFLSGLFGAGYDPIKSNPYVWGLYARSVVLNLTR